MAKARRRGPAERFARLPLAVLQSPAWMTLAHAARTTLTVLAAQFISMPDGSPANGHQKLTREVCRRFGLDHSHALAAAAELERRGLITRTHRPHYRGAVHRWPSSWALAWLPVTHRDHTVLDDKERAPDGWREWEAAQPEPPGHETKCTVCDSVFRARRSHARYCSGGCRQAAARARDVFAAGLRPAVKPELLASAPQQNCDTAGKHALRDGFTAGQRPDSSRSSPKGAVASRRGRP